MPFIRSKSPSPSRSSVPSTRSAGNLFGTTRISHPPVLPGVPLRYARISGGVLSSRPSQKRTERVGFDGDGFDFEVAWPLLALGRDDDPAAGYRIFSQIGHELPADRFHIKCASYQFYRYGRSWLSRIETTSKRHATPDSRLRNKYDSAIALRRRRFCHVRDSKGEPKLQFERALTSTNTRTFSSLATMSSSPHRVRKRRSRMA